MPKTLSLKSTVDDALRTVALTDFSGMLKSELDLLDLDLQSWNDCSNVLLQQGKAVGRDGYIQRATLSAIADGMAFFYDSDGARRAAVWIGGNLYSLNLSSWATTLIDSSSYATGTRVVSTVLNRVLYYSDGTTIRNSGADDSGVSYWNPATGASGMVISSGSGATIETPAAKAMCAYNGQLVLGNLKYVGGTLAPDTLIWSNVLDVTTIVGTNIFAVGNGQGGAINSITPFRVGAEGISPFKALFVGKERSCYQLSGALTPSTLAETLITAEVGVLDGFTVQAVPVVDGNRSLQILWLGSDRQVWSTDGVGAAPLTLTIKTELYNWISDRIAADADQEFNSYLDLANGLYVLDVGGNRQYCYDYRVKGWTKFNGLPNGCFVAAKDSASRDIVLVVDHASARLCQVNTGTDDNGSAINPWIKSAAIHGGDPTEDKTWHWVYAFWSTDDSALKVTATSRLGQGDFAEVTLQPASVAAGTFSKFDQAIFDTDVFAEGEITGYVPMQAKGRLVQIPTNAPRRLLKGSTVQVKIEQPSTSNGRFELLAIFLKYLPGGSVRHAPLS